MDETAFQGACATRATTYVTGIVDLTCGPGPARLLNIVAGRNASALISWINECDNPLYGIRRLLGRSHDHQFERSWERLLAGSSSK